MADEQIIVDIKVDSKEVEIADDRIDKLTDSIEDLGNVVKATREQNKQYKKSLADLDKQLDEGTISTESHKKQTKLLNEEIKKNNIHIAKTSVELSKQKRERTANIKLITSETNVYDKLSARLNILRKNAKNVGAQFGTNSKQFKTAAAQVGKLDSKLKLIDNELGQNQRSVGKYTNALKGLGQQIAGALGITAGVTLLIDQFRKAAQRIGILNKLTRQLKGTFDITTKEAKKLASQINAMAQNFDDIDTKNLQISLTAIVKTFKDLSEQEALDLIQDGFSKGSNNSGEFLDILKEYPVFFKKAGLSAGEMFAIINQQVKEGVYSDKGVDAIKEATISLTENTQIVKDALKPLGESVNLQIRQKVEAGKAFEAMQLISKEMETLGENSAEAQTIMADVFKGAGEDSDTFVRNLHNVNLTLDEVEKQTSITTEANLRLSEAYNNFLLSVEDGSGIVSSSIASITDMGSELLEVTKVFNETDFSNKLKLMANSVLALINRFIPLVALYNTLTGSNVKLSFEIENTNDIIDENTESVKENEKEIKKETETTETAVEATKRLGEAKKKAAKEERENAKEKAKIAKQIAEDAKRVEAAEKKLIELDNQRRLSGIENAKQLRDERIKIEKETLKKSLENEKLFSIEKEALIQQSALNIAKINKEFNEDEVEREKVVNQTIQDINNEFAEAKREQDKEDLEERAEFLQEFFGNITAMSAQFVGEEAILFGNMASSIAKAFEDGKISAEEAVEGIATITVSVFDLMTAKRNEDLAENEAARQKELELAEGNAQAQDKINLFYDKKNSELKRKQFNADKAKALIDIAIATAVGAAKALPNLILAGIVTGFGIAQGVLVATKKPPKFGKGTSNIVGIGDSHASGNDTDVWGFSGGQKQYFGKVEKGEAMPVIRKSAANDYMIAKLNGRFSSRGGKFADGTPDITEQGQAQNNEVFVNNLVDAFSNIQIVAKIEDITKEAGKKIEIVDNSKV